MSLPNARIPEFDPKDTLKGLDEIPVYDYQANYTYRVNKSVFAKFLSTFQKYSAKTYYSDEVYVVQGTGIYQLVNNTRPYISSNFTTELANGDWELLVDFTAGSPPDLTPFVTKNGAQNEIKVSPTTIEDWGNILDGSGKATLKALIDFIGARLGATLNADDIIQTASNQMISQAEKDRLAELKDRFVGEYETLSALQSAHPTANKADIAWVRPSGGSKTEYEYDGGWGIKPGGGGVSLPTGGTTGQVLKKASNAEGEYEWGDDETGSAPAFADITGSPHSNEALVTALDEVYNSSATNVLDNITGDPSTLNTTNKLLTPAVNELLGIIGVIGSLNTTDKSNLVSAINEVLASGGGTDHTAEIAALEEGKKDKYITVPTTFTPGQCIDQVDGTWELASATVEPFLLVVEEGKAVTSGSNYDLGLPLGVDGKGIYYWNETDQELTLTKPTGEGEVVRVAYKQGTGWGVFVWDNGYIIGTTTAPPANEAPTANAGTDATITLPTNSIQLDGSGSDSDGTITGYLWTQQAGPGAATFNDDTIADPTVSNLIEGSYIFRLTVTDDDGATDTDDVTITVNPEPAPQISAQSTVYGEIIVTEI